MRYSTVALTKGPVCLLKPCRLKTAGFFPQLAAFLLASFNFARTCITLVPFYSGRLVPFGAIAPKFALKCSLVKRRASRASGTAAAGACFATKPKLGSASLPLAAFFGLLAGVCSP